VTITHGIGSYDAGSLDASSAMNVVSNDVNIYNINFENTYGTAGQVGYNLNKRRHRLI
jgi:pectinesterase